MEKFGRWFRRRGWFGDASAPWPKRVKKFNLDGDDGMTGAEDAIATAAAATARKTAPVVTRREKWWGRSEVGVRIIVEYVWYLCGPTLRFVLMRVRMRSADTSVFLWSV